MIYGLCHGVYHFFSNNAVCQHDLEYHGLVPDYVKHDTVIWMKFQVLQILSQWHFHMDIDGYLMYIPVETCKWKSKGLEKPSLSLNMFDVPDVALDIFQPIQQIPG